MKKEILSFIRKNNLSPFNKNKTLVKTEGEEIYKTKDAKAVHTRLISTLGKNFHFSETSNLFNFFEFTGEYRVISERQKFFSEIKDKIDGNFLNSLATPKVTWRPKYGIVVVTEDEKTFNELQKLGCPTKFLITQSDLDSLDDYDIVQVVECENFSRILETLPQSVFLDSLDEVYLERYVSLLSSWKNNIDILNSNNTNEDIKKILIELGDLMDLLEDSKKSMIKREDVESKLDEINSKVSENLKTLTFSGESMFSMLSKSKMPDEIVKIIDNAIEKSGMPENIFNAKIPVEINEDELERLVKKQNAQEHTGIAEKIKKKADKLVKVPEKLNELADLLLMFDFISGISEFNSKADAFPIDYSEIIIKESSNLFLDKAQEISFYLDDANRCSILTGANSGGKTTLLEHMIQIISMMQIGLPVTGEIKLPIFSDVYYFAKNKGSMNKGAFETLLLQMSKIKPGKKTLILADEIESVTEPGVAGAIVCATADFFIKQGCFMVVATHLGKEIQKNLPKGARIDGIEAKGLDENYELIVDHNPVLGRLANSTPELIIEKMANAHKTDYFNYLYSSILKDRK